MTARTLKEVTNILTALHSKGPYPHADFLASVLESALESADSSPESADSTTDSPVGMSSLADPPKSSANSP